MIRPCRPAGATPTAQRRRGASEANSSQPVDRLTLGHVPDTAVNLNVTGKRLSGPLQGFGQLWQKTYRVRLDGASASPQDVAAVWKREFGSFLAEKGARFYAPFAEIAPGEVGLMDQDLGGRQSSRRRASVIYADDVPFTFMTPRRGTSSPP